MIFCFYNKHELLNFKGHLIGISRKDNSHSHPVFLKNVDEKFQYDFIPEKFFLANKFTILHL
jgi:hypothetical protein